MKGPGRAGPVANPSRTRKYRLMRPDTGRLEHFSWDVYRRTQIRPDEPTSDQAPSTARRARSSSSVASSPASRSVAATSSRSRAAKRARRRCSVRRRFPSLRPRSAATAVRLAASRSRRSAGKNEQSRRRPQLGRGRSAGAGDAAPVGRRKAGRWGRLVHGGSDAGAGPLARGRPGSGLLPLYGARPAIRWSGFNRDLPRARFGVSRPWARSATAREGAGGTRSGANRTLRTVARGRSPAPAPGRRACRTEHRRPPAPDHAPGGRVGRAYSPSLLGHERTSRSRTGSSVERATGHRAGDRSRSSSRRTLVSGGESHAFKGSSPHCTPRS